MIRILFVVWALTTVVILSSGALGETIELVSGQTLVGDIRLQEDDQIIIDARFPMVRQMTLTREELTADSWYHVLERRTDQKDPLGRMKLGEYAEMANLHGVAIAEYRAAKQLDAGLANEIDKRIVRLRNEVARNILNDAERLLAEGDARAALMYFHTIVELYPDTEAAKRAEKIKVKAHSLAGKAADVNVKTVPLKKAPEIIRKIESALKKGNERFIPLRGHVGSSSKDRKTAEQGVRYYEDAWKLTKSLPVATGDDDLQKTFKNLRLTVKAQLVEAYLAIGTIYLQRKAISESEKYCQKACELAPEDRKNHALHRLIIEAKIYDSRGWRR